MRKLLMFVLMVMMVSTSFAQFKASPKGVVAVNGDEFYVVNIEGKTAQQLYDGVNAWVMSTFKYPDVVASKEDGKIIKIHGIFPDAVFIGKRFGLRDFADIEVDLMIYFKDGKIRFDIPVIGKMTVHPLEKELYFSGGGLVGINMFKKDGRENKPEIIASFNSFLNGTISDIVKSVRDSSKRDW